MSSFDWTVRRTLPDTKSPQWLKAPFYGTVSDEDNTPTFTHMMVAMTDPQDTAFDAVERNYRQQVITHYNRLALTGLPERDPGLHGVPLDKVFVKLDMQVRRIGSLDPEAERERSQLEQELADLEQRGQWGERWRLQELQARIEELKAEARKPRLETLSVAEVLHRQRRLTIVGGPGSGKTTLTRWLALTFAQDRQAEPDRLGADFVQPRLPILLELRRFADHLHNPDKHPIPDLVEEIAAYVSEHAYYSDTPVEFIEEALANGSCILLVDGLDEIAELEQRRCVVEALNALLRRADRAYSSNLCIVTSRPHGYRDVDLGAGFQTGQVKPFAPDDVRLFVMHWYETAYGADVQEEAATLNAAIDANERVSELATNPLLCTIIAIVFRNNRVLPNRRVELYLKCCEAMLDTWERNKDIRDSGLIGKYDWQTKLALLAPIAYWLHSESERFSAPETQFVEQLAEVLVDKRLAEPGMAEQEARGFLVAMRDRSGLLQGRGDGSLEFAHRTFQEYLAARFIAAQPDPDYIDMVMSHLHEEWWREVHLLVIGHLGSGGEDADKASELLLHIIRLYHPPILLLRTAPSIVGGLIDLFDKYEGRKVYALVILFNAVKHSPYLIRKSIARNLPGLQAERRITSVLAREFEFVHEGFGDCTPLGTTKEIEKAMKTEAESLLLQIVRDPGRQEEKHDLRETAASSLVRLGQASSEVISALIRSLDDGYVPVREAAASSLVQLGQVSPEVVAALIQALNDSSGRVRQAAASSLVQLGQASPEVISILIHALDDIDLDVCRAAAFSLVQLEQASPEVIAAVINTMGNKSGLVRQVAASSLVQMGQTNPDAVSALIHALSNDDSIVCEMAASSLGELGYASPEVVSTLIQALDDTSGRMRQAAAFSLGELEKASPEVVSALLHNTLNDTSGHVRQAAASSLVQLGQPSPEVISVLISALSNDDPDVCEIAASSLGELEQASPEVICALIQALDNSSGRLRQAAASSLIQLEQVSSEVVSALLHALEEKIWYVSSGGVSSRLIQSVQSFPKVRFVLTRAFGERDSSLQEAAAVSLGGLEQANPEVVSALIKTLDDKLSSVRQVAVTSLGQLGQTSPEVVSALINTLNDNSVFVRQAAVSSLIQLGQDSPEDVPVLIHALGDNSPFMFQAVTSSLGQLQVEDESMLRSALIVLNRDFHGIIDRERRVALESLRNLLDGRPFPGYQWKSLRERRERQRRVRRLVHGVSGVCGIIFAALFATWFLGFVDPNSFLGYFLYSLTVMAAVGAALSQILGLQLRGPGD